MRTALLSWPTSSVAPPTRRWPSPCPSPREGPACGRRRESRRFSRGSVVCDHPPLLPASSAVGDGSSSKIIPRISRDRRRTARQGGTYGPRSRRWLPGLEMCTRVPAWCWEPVSGFEPLACRLQVDGSCQLVWAAHWWSWLWRSACVCRRPDSRLHSWLHTWHRKAKSP